MSLFWQVALTKPFDLSKAQEHARQIQYPALYISIAYVIVIFSVKAIMAKRKPYQLTSALNFWNTWLAVFSLLGSLITTPALLYSLQTQGLTGSYCETGSFFTGASGYWVWLFILSKIAELGDTLLIVLRKKPLIFLHWYHHVLTLNYGFLSFMEGTAFNSWIVWLNFTVHAFMYSYYFLRSLGVRVPASIAQSITLMQIGQFVITHLILFHVGYRMLTGQSCHVTTHTFWFCLLMEMSYLALFSNFFYQSYVAGGGKKYNAERQQTVMQKTE